MKKFTVKVCSTVYLKADIEANSQEEAEEKAHNLDGGLFVEDGFNDSWEIISVTENRDTQ